ncbi:MAG: GGDEF domain-containing protein, partial [Planctomycetota bacterium]
ITQFENEVRRARRQGTPLSLIFTDLDHFKEVNDTLGHLEGDRLLKEVAELLRGSVRESDLVCRFGGDEFVIILPATDLAAARRKADELHGAFDEYPFSYLKAPGCDRRRVRVTVSVGVTSTRGDDEPGKILTSADTALYQAKRTGRDRVVVFEPSDPEPA